MVDFRIPQRIFKWDFCLWALGSLLIGLGLWSLLGSGSQESRHNWSSKEFIDGSTYYVDEGISMANSPDEPGDLREELEIGGIAFEQDYREFEGELGLTHEQALEEFQRMGFETSVVFEDGKEWLNIEWPDMDDLSQELMARIDPIVWQAQEQQILLEVNGGREVRLTASDEAVIQAWKEEHDLP